MNKKKIQKNILYSALFLILMFLTFFVIFREQSFSKSFAAMKELSAQSFFAAIFLAIFFVSLEAYMIFFLLKRMGEKTTLLLCISYSFIGFFFSAITPSATGGQPMQLYYMKKDGNALSSSAVVLMTVAILYKFVLVLIGIGILIFWFAPLRQCLKGYFYLYLFGLFLNVIVVIVLLLVMFSPNIILSAYCGLENIISKIFVSKRQRYHNAKKRERAVQKFVTDYQEMLKFLCRMKKEVLFLTFITFCQRSTVFVLTYVIYRGLGLHGTSGVEIFLMQAAIYVAVDMLPIPGAQGITEAIYQSVFANIFSTQYLLPSLCIMRGISFYFMLLIGLLIFLIRSAFAKDAVEKKHFFPYNISMKFLKK